MFKSSSHEWFILRPREERVWSWTDQTSDRLVPVSFGGKSPRNEPFRGKVGQSSLRSPRGSSDVRLSRRTFVTQTRRSTHASTVGKRINMLLKSLHGGEVTGGGWVVTFRSYNLKNWGVWLVGRLSVYSIGREIRKMCVTLYYYGRSRCTTSLLTHTFYWPNQRFLFRPEHTTDDSLLPSLDPNRFGDPFKGTYTHTTLRKTTRVHTK